MDYSEFLRTKAHADELFGFKPLFMPDFLYPFQAHLTDWSIRKGRAALFEDCGLGKTPQELVVAENIVRKENRPVLILTPLAVGLQMVAEGNKFSIEVHRSRDGRIKKGINVTNYEQLEKYNPKDFAGVICDESSILKHHDAKTRKRVTAFLHEVKYRLLATATPSPNDYMELGTSSEALGPMSRNQMLGMFFSHESDDTQQWTLKGHARKRFWRWVCTWARALRKPSDLGFNDGKFKLPELNTEQHVVKNGRGFGLFHVARTLKEQRQERKTTIQDRCEKVAELVKRNGGTSLVWCHLNGEGELLEKMIRGSINVQGSDNDDKKEETLTAFAKGQLPVLITKPKIGGWGLNLQVCRHMTMFPSHSWESYYQCVRRCWRFGQKKPVKVDIVTSEGESRVIANMKRKEHQMDAMFAQLVEEMNEYQLSKKHKEREKETELPSWL